MKTKADVTLATTSLTDDLAFFQKTLGFRLETIFPADDPRVAVLTGHNAAIRLDRTAQTPPGTLTLGAEDPSDIAGGQKRLTSPGGTEVLITSFEPEMLIPEAEHQFFVRRLADEAPWVVGRAGMHYRDLIPERLGGSIIASHIRIPDGGPVPDMVHYHTVGFQLIFCYRGWVDLVYEDQGPPFRLHAGCCVIQPPEIRHRVLFASENIEVIEIGVPAEHVTTIDHDMTLPTETYRPERRFHGQRFVHHKADEATWEPFRLPGFEARDTTIADNTQGVASVMVARASDGQTEWTHHSCDVLFSFVMEGSAQLEGEGQPTYSLQAGDAFVIPPGMLNRITNPSADFEMLEVALPGGFETTRHTA